MSQETHQSQRSLCAKEIAFEIGRHVNFVYAMRALGYVGDTAESAQEWIEQNGFVIRNGNPILKAERKVQ